MATAIARKTTAPIVIVGASPQGLPDFRKDRQTYFFVDDPTDFNCDIVPPEARHVIITNRLGEHETKMILSRMKEVAPNASRTLVVPGMTLTQTLVRAKEDLTEVTAGIVVYTPLTTRELPPGTTQNEDGILVIPCDRIRRSRSNPRKRFDPNKIRILAESIKAAGQVTPGAVRRVEDDPHCDWEIAEGERRWLACQRVGEAFLAHRKSFSDSGKQLIFSVIANFLREKHTPLEIAQAIKNIKEGDRNLTMKDIGAYFGGKTDAWVCQHLQILELHPAVQAMTEVGEDDDPEKVFVLRFTTAHLLKDLPQKDQLETAKHIVKHRLSYHRASSYIRSHALAKGITGFRKSRSPKADFRILDTYLRKNKDTGKSFLDMDDDAFAGMFQFRSPSDREKAVGELAECVEILTKIRRRVLKAPSMEA